jgi:hypothetical protein
MPSKPAKDGAPSLYTRRRPAETPLYQVVQKHFETFRALCQDDWEERSMPAYAEREFRRYLECGILAHGFARARCDQCGHDFLVAFSCKGRGVCPSCNTRRMVETAAHLVDPVFPKLPVRQWRGLFSQTVALLSSARWQGTQCGSAHCAIEPDEAKAMLAWTHAGGFSVDANVRIEGSDRRGLERLLRYCARPPFALERIEMLDEHRLLYHLTKPMHDGRTCVHLTPLELIGCLAALVPAPRSHRHRYYGVLAPNARLRPAVTALIDDTQAPSETGPDGDEQPDGAKRSPARYLWAMLLARIYEAFPLACPVCGSPMTIIAFITDPPIVHHILGAHRRADHTPADLTGS